MTSDTPKSAEFFFVAKYMGSQKLIGGKEEKKDRGVVRQENRETKGPNDKRTKKTESRKE